MSTDYSKIINNWERWALPVFLLLAVIIRFGTFFPSVINHDESTYIIIGNGLLNGQTYLVDSFDTKPIGIFLVYALFNFLSGGSIFLMRLFTALVVGLTAFLVYRLGRKATGESMVGIAAGVFYILLASIFKYYGLSPNTELFFVPFAVAAVLLVWGKHRKTLHYTAAGLLLGVGFVIKYVIAADALAIGLIVLWQGWQNKNLLKAIAAQALPMTLAFFIPILLVYNYYVQIDQVDNFLFYTLQVTSKYPVDAAAIDRLLFVLDFFGRFFLFTILAVLAYLNKPSRSLWTSFLLLWLLCVTIITLVPGKTFGHYQVQMMPVLALMAAHYFASHKNRTAKKLRGFFMATMVLVLGIGIALFQYYSSKTDNARLITQALEQRLEVGEQVYTGDYHHIVYHLLGQESATPYVHSSLLHYAHHVNALGIDLDKEAKRIVHEVQPRYVLFRKDEPSNALREYIYQHYQQTEELVDGVLLLEPKK